MDAQQTTCESAPHKPKVKGLPPQHFSRGLRTGNPPGVKNVLAVHSGKGGVGKTFVAVNLAMAMIKKGFKVGILDADVDCPNVMKMLKLEGKLIANANKKMIPLEKFGLKIVSLAPMLESDEEAVLWRGPIVSRVVEQLLHDTEWGELDYLVVDLPPGTSDIPLSVLQMLGDARVLVVTTPHELAVMDARRSIRMVQKLHCEVAGIIENMAGDVFGSAGENKLAADAALELAIPLLGTIELKGMYAENPQSGETAIDRDPYLAELFSNVVQKICTI